MTFDNKHTISILTSIATYLEMQKQDLILLKQYILIQLHEVENEVENELENELETELENDKLEQQQQFLKDEFNKLNKDEYDKINEAIWDEIQRQFKKDDAK